MKFIFIFLLSLSLSSASFAACNTKRIKRQLISMFNVAGKTVDWRSVRHKRSFERLRSPLIFIRPTGRLHSSRIQIKRNSYLLGNISVCEDPKNKGYFLLTHPNYKGTLSVARRGTKLHDSVVRFQKNNSVFLKFYLRPESVVID